MTAVTAAPQHALHAPGHALRVLQHVPVQMPRHGHQYVPQHVSDLTPWDVSRHVPQDGSRASLEDVRFLLWTSNNAGNDEYQTLKEGDLTTLGHFNGNDPTVVVVHGFGDHGDKGWAVTAKTELLKLGSYNVICVEWGRLAVSPWYPSAVNNVPKVRFALMGDIAHKKLDVVTSFQFDICGMKKKTFALNLDLRCL
ncbi:Pancreatic lipase-related protein 2 [Portunus trituberculatus]|uniref:Pancreatic lipase-related protein 2 n=1 Tax=Portunus trituberculatus TaxID=210409 RepID=A0A5B7K0I1_PORTR|nr:Pancreatic lipase-related protein 2 [Portunus trituberculatus]